MAWDPKTYLVFGEERTRPAHELLARVPTEHPKRVVDLGCGPGNSTALLASRWPEADVEGVDNSHQMLAEARAAGIKARWRLANVARWEPGAPCDAIFSNATLQWVRDHEALLPRLMAQLAPGGVFAFQ